MTWNEYLDAVKNELLIREALYFRGEPYLCFAARSLLRDHPEYEEHTGELLERINKALYLYDGRKAGFLPTAMRYNYPEKYRLVSAHSIRLEWLEAQRDPVAVNPNPPSKAYKPVHGGYPG